MAEEEAVALPSLDEILGRIDGEVEEERRQVEAEECAPLALHASALEAAAAGRQPLDGLLAAGGGQGRALALCGGGLMVVPLVSRTLLGREVLSYKELAAADRRELEARLGGADPSLILEELEMSERALGRRLEGMETEKIKEELTVLEDWQRRAGGRVWALKQRAAWSVLGIGETGDREAIRRAFKRRALELHPDKGGDADDFQLLQEMREVLLAEAAARPRGRRRKGGKAPKAEVPGEEEEQKALEEGQEESDAEGSSSEGEAEAREAEKAWKEQDEEGAFSWMDDSQKERARLETSRKRLHRAAVELWRRSGKLAADAARVPEAGGGARDAVHALRAALDRFTASEMAALRPGKPKDALELLSLFLQQAGEVLCAAAASEPATAVAEVAMRLNQPLLAAGPSPELLRRCSALLEAVKAVPSTYERIVAPLEGKLDKRAAEKDLEEDAPRLCIRLLLPEAAGPGPVEVELPAGATVADLRERAAALISGPFRLRRGGKLLEEATEPLDAQAGSEVALEPEALDAEYPAWATAERRRAPAGPALVKVSAEVTSVQGTKAAAPARPAAHEIGCTCFKCIRRRQFKK